MQELNLGSNQIGNDGAKLGIQGKKLFTPLPNFASSSVTLKSLGNIIFLQGHDAKKNELKKLAKEINSGKKPNEDRASSSNVMLTSAEQLSVAGQVVEQTRK